MRAPHPPSLSTPPLRRAQTPVKLAFTVASIDALRPVVGRLGGAVDHDDTRWHFRGAMHCDCVDPEGNIVQLIQHGLAPEACTPGGEGHDDGPRRQA